MFQNKKTFISFLIQLVIYELYKYIHTIVIWHTGIDCKLKILVIGNYEVFLNLIPILFFE